MKKLNIGIALFTMAAMTACGDAGGDEKAKSDGAETVVKEDISSEEAEVATSEFSDVQALASKNEFTTEELSRATVFIWEKEALITGYPRAYASDPEMITLKSNSDCMTNNADVSSSDLSIKVKFKDQDSVVIAKGSLFGVKGDVYISYSSGAYGNPVSISIYNAEIVELDEQNTITPTDLNGLDLSKQIFCGDLSDVMKAHYETLVNKESITVSGAFSHIVSSGSLNEAGEYSTNIVYLEPKVTCSMNSVPDSDYLNGQRTAGAAIKIRGKFSGSYTSAELVEAEIIK